MKQMLIALFAGVCLLFPQIAAAWNETGHQTVALLAWRELDPAQQQALAKILLSHPHYQLYLASNRPPGVSEAEWAFVRAASWPDFVRPSRPGTGEVMKGRDITHFHQGPWHYTDIPFVPPSDRTMINPTTLPAAKEPNVLTALAANEKALSAKETAPQDRAVALAWVEHLIGDLHQPLHAATEYSSAYPAGDKGGNAQVVRGDGMVINLHAYWDDALGTSDAFVGIDFLARLIHDDPGLSREKLTELQTDTQPSQWVDESFQDAVALVYLNGRLRSARADAYYAHEITPEQVPALPPSYASNARDLAKRRVALASYRLADALKTMLAAPQP